jgi:hypothetical protein
MAPDRTLPEPDRVNLRCPYCGQIRTPIISPLLPDAVVVICEPCYRRHLLAAVRRELLKREPDRWADRPAGIR